MAIITPALGAARASLDQRFPNRDRATDGWIGDEAHRGTRSGHNPDETGNAEYEDSDNLDEVRAVDLDKDLRHPTLTMHDVVRAILATPADRDRCSYLIYDRTIWSRSAGYQPRTYTGSNPHTSHLHISGRPTNDADGRPWLSIERLGIEDDMTREEFLEHFQWALPKVRVDLTHQGRRLWAGQLMGRDSISLEEALMWGLGVAVHAEAMPALTELRGQLAGLATMVDQLAAADPTPVTPEQLAAMIAAVQQAARGGAADALEAATARFTVDGEPG